MYRIFYNNNNEITAASHHKYLGAFKSEDNYQDTEIDFDTEKVKDYIIKDSELIKKTVEQKTVEEYKREHEEKLYLLRDARVKYFDYADIIAKKIDDRKAMGINVNEDRTHLARYREYLRDLPKKVNLNSIQLIGSGLEKNIDYEIKDFDTFVSEVKS